MGAGCVADELRRKLERALVPHDVKEYPEAGHGFMNRHGTVLLKLLPANPSCALQGQRFVDGIASRTWVQTTRT